ncbi:MAG: hypothetical protein M3N16_00525 [Actinomycetota bacterium]|nr:hypothetical protein [Actinomycetota bacterium]
MRRLILSLVVAGGVAVTGAAPAAAQGPPMFVELPEQACENRGTHNAHGRVPAGNPAHPHIPHSMTPPGFTEPFCMTMPARNPGHAP